MPQERVDEACRSTLEEWSVDTHTALMSSSLVSAGYLAADELLELRFRSGALYQYLKVPRAVHVALVSAASKGRYFNESIRGRFEFRRCE